MKKLLIVVILEKIMAKMLEKETLSKSVRYIQSSDKAHVLSKLLRYLKIFLIVFLLASIIIACAAVYGIYLLFTRFA